MKVKIYLVHNFKNILSKNSTGDVTKRFDNQKEAMKYFNRSKRFYTYSEVQELTY